MERFKLMTLVSTVIACAVSTSVMAKPALSPDVKAYIDQQIAQLGGAKGPLEMHDWNNLCTPGSIANGCTPDCSGSKKIACERVLSQTHATALIGVPYSFPNLPIVTNGMFVQSFAPTSSSSSFGPFLTLVTGSNSNACTLHNVSGTYISNRGTFQSSAKVTQYRNTSATGGGNYYGHTYSEVGSGNTNEDLFQSGGIPVGETFYIICLGYGYPADNAVDSEPVGTITATW